MKVYMVTSGEYSDFTVEGIFSTREKAEMFRAELARGRPGYGGPNDIEEWTIDGRAEDAYGPTWIAYLRMTDGDLTTREYHKVIRHPSRCEVQVRDAVVYATSPISTEHAAKVAAEHRQAILRETPDPSWVPPWNAKACRHCSRGAIVRRPSDEWKPGRWFCNRCGREDDREGGR